jgi:site-specific DNA-methyltransferase (adenine-specific)
MINLYHGDCMEAMKSMKDKCYDLAIVDPPYGIGFDGEVDTMVTNNASGKWSGAKGKGYTRKEWDKDKPSAEYFSELFRVSKRQIVWGGNYFDLPTSGGWIVWDKKRPESFSLSQAELAWCSFGGSVAVFQYLWNGFQKAEPENRFHPTQKPVKLYRWLLNKYAKEGDKILDTHGGSMSIALACHDMGFDLDLWEIDKDYYEAGVKRYENHIKQLNIFHNPA